MTQNTNTDGIGGHFLCSGHLKNFKAVGELGQSVYQVASALREAIRRSNQPSQSPLECFLAIPQANNSSQEVDWYADERLNTSDSSNTSVVNWNQATPEEQEIARHKLLHFEQEIKTLSNKLLEKSQGAKGDLFTFASLLPKTLITPSQLKEIGSAESSSYIIDPSYIYLVGAEQHPVLAFWGFNHPNAKNNQEPFHFLHSPVKAAPILATAPPLVAAAPITSDEPVIPVVETKRSIWSWLRWLLLALLFLFLLFFVWRSCSRPSLPSLPTASLSSPSLTTPTQTPRKLWGFDLPNWLPSFGSIPTISLPSMGKPDVSLPSMSMPDLKVPDLSMPDLSMPDLGLPSANLDSNTTPPIEPGSVIPPSESIADVPNVAPPVLEPELAQPPSTIETPLTLGPELQIPPQLANQAMPSYINGDWQVHAIQDQKTGRPVRLEYSIQDGEGLVRIHQGNNVSCLGAVEAIGQSSALHITSTNQASCSDGSSYDMPQVECRLNARQETECFGRYGNQQFPISMRHAAK